jgi:hypothetical protein
MGVRPQFALNEIDARPPHRRLMDVSTDACSPVPAWCEELRADDRFFYRGF